MKIRALLRNALSAFGLIFSLLLTTQAALAEDYLLVYSETADRAGSFPLEGATVSGDLFGRLDPETGGITRVFYYLDGASEEFKTEYSAPYDLNGGSSTARAYDTTALSDGLHTIRAEILLDTGEFINVNTSFTVANSVVLENVAPVLSSIGNQSVDAGSFLNLTLSASDLNGDVLSIVAQGLPNFASFSDNGNGSASLSFSPTDTDINTYSITITVSDGEFSDSETFQLTVNEAGSQPYSLVYSIENDRAGQIPLEGATVSGDLFGRLYPETGGITSVLYYLDGSNSSFKLETQAPYDLNGGASTARAFDTTALSDGVHTIRAQVTFSGSDIIYFTTSFTVDNGTGTPNSAPVLNPIGNQTLQVGNSLNIPISASDSDLDPLSFGIQNLPSFANFTDNGNGTATLAVNPVIGEAGVYPVTVIVTDGELSDTETFQITVTDPIVVENLPPVLNAIGPQSGLVDQTLQIQLSASDPNNDSLTFTLTSGPSFVGLTDNSNGTATITGLAGASSVGQHSLTVVVSDGELTDTETFTLTITEPVIENQAPVLAVIGAQSIETESTLNLNFSATDPDGNTGLVMQITNAPAFVSFSDLGNGSASFAASPSASDTGSFNITISVTDGELTDSETFQLLVEAPATHPYSLVYSMSSDRSGQIPLEGATVSGDLYGRLLPETGDIASVLYYLDGSTSAFKTEYSAPYDLNGGSSTARAYDTSLLSDGLHTVRAVITLDSGETVVFDTTFIVANNAPVENVAPVMNAASNMNVPAETTSSQTLSATDINGDTLSFTASSLPGFISFQDNGNNTASVSVQPAASDVGSYPITVTVTDGEFTDLTSFTVVVSEPIEQPYYLVNSGSWDRSGSAPLDGQVVSGNLYGRMLPETGGITRVFYYLDGSNSEFKREFSPPYDLAGGPSNSAQPYDTTQLSDGSHVIRSEVLLDSGEIINFDTTIIVANNGPVNVAPVLSAIGAQNLQAGASLVVNIAATDTNGDALSFTSSNAPAFVQLVDNGNGTATLSLNPGLTDVGTVNMTVTVSDGLLQDSENISITVTAPAIGGSLVINEFVAGNDTDYVDGEDWIELYNNGDQTVDLAGWCLTDDAGIPDLWCFASGSLAAGEYLILVADDPDVPTDLHTNFKLGKGGEYLGLYQPDGAVASEYAPEFPQQYDDVAYGLDADGNPRYFPTPTPAAANGEGVSDFFSFDPDQITFNSATGLLSQIVNLTTLGEVTEAYTLSTDDNGLGWLAAEALIDEDGVTPDQIQITADPSGLAEGTYTATVNANAAGIGTGTVEVTLIVSGNSSSDGELILNEFVAGNDTDFVDGEDWLEIYNPGSTSVDLTGWCLTDDETNPSQWCFTSGSLAAGEYLIVIADDPDVPTDLHTNFKLGKGGEYLALLKPGGSVATEYAPAFPQQYDDIAYGLNTDGEARYFPTPTPGAANGAGVTDFLDFAPASLNFAVSAGTSSSQTVLSTLAAASTAYSLVIDDAGAGWLSASAANGEDNLTDDVISVDVNTDGLGDGSYTGTVTATADGFGSAVLTVNLTVAGGGASSGSLRLNEFMASNGSTFLDGEDWFEIFNDGSTTVDLAGWCVTDDVTEPAKWCFTGGQLAAGEYLVVIADNPDVADDQHAGFKLGAGGEYFGIYRPDGAVAHEYAPEYPEQSSDISYGINPDGELRFFPVPTPGAANNDGVSTLGSLISLSHQRGFYSQGFDLSLTVDATADSVRYTTNGSWPSETDGSVYNGPISIDGTTIVRFAVIVGGSVAEKVSTHTYLFLDDILAQSDMDQDVVNAYSDEIEQAMQAVPTMSIAANPDEITGSDGFYTGDDVEKAISVEVIYADDPAGSHQANSGIESHSHLRAKRSLRLNFRSEYGDSKFNTDLMARAPLHGDSASTRLDKIILRGGNNRCWCRDFNPDKTTYTIDQFYRDTQIDATGSGMRGTYVHLYINGEYHGLYNAVERADKHFLEDYFDGDDADWFSINHGIVHDDAEPLNGDRGRYDYLTTTLVNQDMSQAANYAELQEYIEIDHFIDYLLVSWWTGVGDWPDNNWYAGSRGATSELGTTGLYFFAWDGEWSWDAPADFSNDGHRAKIHPAFRSNKTIGDYGTSSPDNPFIIAQIWHAARQNADFMARVQARADALLGVGGALSDSVAQTRWLALTDYVREAVIGESARWGDQVSNPPRERDTDWQDEVDTIFDLLDGNANELRSQLVEEGFISN